MIPVYKVLLWRRELFILPYHLLYKDDKYAKQGFHKSCLCVVWGLLNVDSEGASSHLLQQEIPTSVCIP